VAVETLEPEMAVVVVRQVLVCLVPRLEMVVLVEQVTPAELVEKLPMVLQLLELLHHSF